MGIYQGVSTRYSADSIRTLGPDANSRSPLQHALWVCATHPGVLADLKDLIVEGVIAPRQLIEEMIKSVFIEFNLLKGRTGEDYQKPNGDWVELTAERREEFLADIAWYMAERHLDALDLSSLPPRIRLSYQIDDDALQRDLRSQTVFELAPLSPTEEAAEDSLQGDMGKATKPQSGHLQSEHLLIPLRKASSVSLFGGRKVIEIEGLQIPVIGQAHLLRNKKAAGRPKDQADVAWLESGEE